MDNAEMDAQVLESIRSGKTRASAVQAHLKLGPNAERSIDRSLQRLRRAGKIAYWSKDGWKVSL